MIFVAMSIISRILGIPSIRRASRERNILQLPTKIIDWQFNFVPANHHICLCELNPEYMPLNNWGHGCAVITIDEGLDLWAYLEQHRKQLWDYYAPSQRMISKHIKLICEL